MYVYTYAYIYVYVGGDLVTNLTKLQVWLLQPP